MTGTYVRQDALKQLTMVYRMAHEHAVRALAIADQLGLSSVATEKGVVSITARSNGQPKYEIDDGIPPAAVAGRPGTGYTGSSGRSSKSSDSATTRRRPTVAGKTTKTVEQDENGELDLTGYATKPITGTMEAFAQWIRDETGYNVDTRSVALSGTLRGDFQRWYNEPSRKAARQAEREGEREAESAPTQAAPAKGRGKAATPPAKPAGRGKAAAGKATAATTAKPRGRGRPKAEAPF